MDKIMYFCKKCDKLYKVGGSGRKVKCNSCGRDLIDLKVSDREYEALDYSEKNSLKYHARMVDTGNDEPDDNVSNNADSEIDKSTVDSFWNNSLFEDNPGEDNTDAAPKKMSSGSFFGMMPESPSEEKSYAPVYAFDEPVKNTSENTVVSGKLNITDDDWSDKRVNFFLIPFFSFVPTKYRQLVIEKGGKVFGALLVWFVILNIITGIIAASGIDKVADELRAELPDFELANGRMTIETPMLEDKDGTYIEIDDSLSGITASNIDEVYKSGYYKQILIAGSDSAGIYSDGRVQVLKYSDLNGFEMSRDKLCNKWIPMLKPLIIIFMIIGAFFSIGVYYLAALIIQFPAGFLGGLITKREFGSVERFRITVLAKFPVFVLIYIIKKFSLKVNLLVNIILQLIFILLVMYFYDKMLAEE